jgi:hypothetical protein
MSASCILDICAEPSRQCLRNTWETYTWVSTRRQWWLNIDLKQGTTLTSATPAPTKALGYIDCLIKEAVEIRLHPRNFNRDVGFNFSWPWYPLTDMMKQYQNSSLEMTPNLENL